MGLIMIRPVHNSYGNPVRLKRRLRGVNRLTAQMFLLLMVIPRSAFPCSLTAEKLREVPPNITVTVSHSGKPIAGIGIEIVPQAEGADAVFNAVTDENGTVQIT